VLSESDEEWLDGEGNLIDEERVLELLENASNYERGLERLNSKDRGVVQKLQNVGNGVVGKKRKRESLSEIFSAMTLISV
jgi:hypothetical protein